MLISVMHNDIQMVKYLLENGTDVNCVVGSIDDTPLHLAAAEGHDLDPITYVTEARFKQLRRTLVKLDLYFLNGQQHLIFCRWIYTNSSIHTNTHCIIIE